MTKLSRRMIHLAVVFGLFTYTAFAQQYEQPPINYGRDPFHDPMAKLQEKLDDHRVMLEFDEKHGYLKSVLKALNVSASSQTLVFSKTSFQQPLISPQAPRAIYFSDDVYIGWVQHGDVVEISSVDPRQGAVFYSLRQQKTARPRFIRHTHECLQCHASSLTRGIPGHVVRSVYPDSSGFPILGAGTSITDYTSPLAERWGGWYVTGAHGDQRHMGNVVVQDRNHPQLPLDQGANVMELADRFRTSDYLTPHSDIVALMVLEYQTQMHNQIAAANYAARQALFDNDVMNRALERPEGKLSESSRNRLASAAEQLVKHILFSGEATLTSEIRGTSDFAAEFSARGHCDRIGRSLRDFDLRRRLFRYPCSYLIYSEAFDALPLPLKSRVYRRMWEVLTAEETSEPFSHLSASDRRAILEIVYDTKGDVPVYWMPDH